MTQKDTYGHYFVTLRKDYFRIKIFGRLLCWCVTLKDEFECLFPFLKLIFWFKRLTGHPSIIREDCYYDSCIFAVHGISILEDLVVALADGVASIYLEFNSVDSDVSSKTNSLDMSLCALSTRELQKLRNEVLNVVFKFEACGSCFCFLPMLVIGCPQWVVRTECVYFSERSFHYGSSAPLYKVIIHLK